MRYQELNEKPKTSNIIKHKGKFRSEEDIMNLLKTNCKEIISIYQKTGKFLWRGIRGVDDMVRINIWKDRQPLQLKKEIHDATNNALTELGLIAHRGNSIFVSPDVGVAGTWGSRYVIFPRDGFKYTWFENVPANNYVFNEISGLNVRYKYAVEDNPDLSLEDFYKEEISKLGPTDNNISQAISEGKEVLIAGDWYYAFSKPYAERIGKWFEIVEKDDEEETEWERHRRLYPEDD